jgi:hypothetical protein
VRCGHVVGVRRHAAADEFGVDVGAAGLGVFVFFEDEGAGARR